MSPDITHRAVDQGTEVQIAGAARMGELPLETKTVIYAWALMSNHAHLLLRSGPEEISTFMRPLLSGYAITYNLRYRRDGHLLQNRYKSIVCEDVAIVIGPFHRDGKCHHSRSLQDQGLTARNYSGF